MVALEALVRHTQRITQDLASVEKFIFDKTDEEKSIKATLEIIEKERFNRHALLEMEDRVHKL